MIEENSCGIEEEIRRNHEKWKKWKLQLKKKDKEKTDLQANKELGVGNLGIPEDNPVEYARMLIEKLEQPDSKECPISKNVAEEMQTNTCTICLQLMAPPNNPYILFPCGHNICKICLFINGDQSKQKYIPRVQKCPLCRTQLAKYAENRNLMKLIHSYMSNKDLLEGTQASKKDLPKKQNETAQRINKLGQHCQLLEGEKMVLHGDLIQLKKMKKVYEEVIERLLDERKRCRRDIDGLQDEARALNKKVNLKEEELDAVETRIAGLEEKQSKIQATLIPLKEKLGSLSESA